MKRVIGLMSGTSLDGIDAALVTIDENEGLEINLKGFISPVYKPKMRERIREACNIKESNVSKICRLNFYLGEFFARTVKQLVNKQNLRLADIDLIGSHGQTIYHDVEDEDSISTLQIGEPAVIAEKTGITTISNFRSRDIAAGGEGAPLVPYVDYLMYRSINKNRVLQNIGGIANYTYLPADTPMKGVSGSDTGPGNMLIDECVSILTSGKLSYDKDGQMAGRGEISQRLLKILMRHKFIKKSAPKTTGREVFGRDLALEVIMKGKKMNLQDVDIVATITAFTSFSIVDAYKRFIKGPIDQVIISGGGSFNPVLVAQINRYCQSELKKAPEVLIQEELGYSSEAKEAIAFAVLAYQTIKGRFNNIPGATGANKQVVLGDITPGRDFYYEFNI